MTSTLECEKKALGFFPAVLQRAVRCHGCPGDGHSERLKIAIVNSGVTSPPVRTDVTESTRGPNTLTPPHPDQYHMPVFPEVNKQTNKQTVHVKQSLTAMNCMYVLIIIYNNYLFNSIFWTIICNKAKTIEISPDLSYHYVCLFFCPFVFNKHCSFLVYN